jgi:hypothetical protein
MKMIRYAAVALVLAAGAAWFTGSIIEDQSQAQAQAQPETTPPAADARNGFVLGSGQWTCGDVLGVAQNGTPLDRGQMFGWIMGYWSAASFAESDAFIASMQTAGGQSIANITIAECRNQPAAAPLYLVTQGIIANSRASLEPQQ